jgi:hypothetical protein
LSPGMWIALCRNVPARGEAKRNPRCVRACRPRRRTCLRAFADLQPPDGWMPSAPSVDTLWHAAVARRPIAPKFAAIPARAAVTLLPVPSAFRSLHRRHHLSLAHPGGRIFPALMARNQQAGIDLDQRATVTSSWEYSRSAVKGVDRHAGFHTTVSVSTWGPEPTGQSWRPALLRPAWENTSNIRAPAGLPGNVLPGRQRK